MSTPLHRFPGAGTYAGAIDNWGYPKGGKRRIRPNILLVVHITDNRNLMDAMAEARYVASNDHSSWTFCNNRDGSTVQLLDPVTQTPWTNGDGNDPNLSLATIRKVFDGNPYNANEFCFATAENVGCESVGAPINAAQIETLASEAVWLADLYEAVYDVPIAISRETVLGHRDFNNVTRHNCPTRGDLDALLGKIIARANALRNPDDAMNARPATYHSVDGRISLKGTYNAFQFNGLDADGKPLLTRYNDLTFDGSGAEVQAFAHWEPDKAVADCYMVSPWVYLPGKGWTDDVWWSRTPLAAPDYTRDEAPEPADVTALKAQIATLTEKLDDATADLAAAQQTAKNATAEAASLRAGVAEFIKAEDGLRNLS